jgi:CRISPR-associated protein Csd2
MNIDPKLTDAGKRYDFLILFDVTDGNPNGDPDAGNLPRTDPETNHGLVTDVCLKRKIRNYVDLVHGADFDEVDSGNRFGIFVRDSGVALNTKLKSAAESVGGKPEKRKENKDARARVCERYYDVRTFGGVLSTGEFNCGQVRGPMQLTFSRSVDPVFAGDVSITRVAITKEGENKENEMGRKATLPYGLYIGKGFYSPMLAKDTGFDSVDLELFWRALRDMFENDRSAARGDMRLQQVFVFRHEDPLGNAHAGKLFDTIRAVKKVKERAPREIGDYAISEPEPNELPEKVTLIKLL